MMNWTEVTGLFLKNKKIKNYQLCRGENNMKTFQNIILIARPAAGKSEIIDYLKRTPLDERIKRFHIGELVILDDFPLLWAWFEEDAILTKMDLPRLHTNKDGYFKHQYFWDVLLQRLNIDYDKINRDSLSKNNITCLIEFSRGKEHGGYARAFENISTKILTDAVILYIKVSWEESLRKNRNRFNPQRPDSILEHSLPDKKLKKLYHKCDFLELTDDDFGIINIKDQKVPYAIFENEDDLTSLADHRLGERLENILGKLWEINS